MNRKRKINDLYKGVFKNNKKSNLIDLKPFQEQNELENDSKNNYELKTKFKYENNLNDNEIHVNQKLKVAKNLGFGNYFQRLRKRIIDIFLDDKEFISYENMFKQKEVLELFNIKNSVKDNYEEKLNKYENQIPLSGQYYYKNESNQLKNLDYYQMQSHYYNKGTENKNYERKKYESNYYGNYDMNYSDITFSNNNFINNPFIPGSNTIIEKNKYRNHNSNSSFYLGNSNNYFMSNNQNRNDNFYYNNQGNQQSKESTFNIDEVIGITKNQSFNYID
jgi:hypothetical protein